MERSSLHLRTNFGEIRRASPADGQRIVQMVGKLAAHHDDTPSLTLDDL